MTSDLWAHRLYARATGWMTDEQRAKLDRDMVERDKKLDEIIAKNHLRHLSPYEWAALIEEMERANAAKGEPK